MCLPIVQKGWSEVIEKIVQRSNGSLDAVGRDPRARRRVRILGNRRFGPKD